MVSRNKVMVENDLWSSHSGQEMPLASEGFQHGFTLNVPFLLAFFFFLISENIFSFLSGNSNTKRNQHFKIQISGS